MNIMDFFNEKDGVDAEGLNRYWGNYREIGRYSDIDDYIKFHNTIDRFVWVLRLLYSSRSIIKSKHYRLEMLFQQYLVKNNISIENIKKLIGKNYSKDDFIYYLKQGWYNELAISYPFKKDPFDIGTIVDFDKSNWKVDMFPSWYIVKAYYAIYTFYNTLPFTNVNKLNTYQHRKTTNHFNNVMLKKFSNNLLYYPFNISIPLLTNPADLRSINRREWKYQYSRYPRNDRKDFYEIENDLIEDFKKAKDELKIKYPVTIVDILYLFRIWANYIGNETVVNLRRGGLLYFLERNLFSITFFMGGFSELMGIALLGEKKFLEEFMDFYSNFIFEKDDLYNNWYKISQITRIRIYNHLNLISNIPKKLLPPNDDLLEFIKD